VLLGERQDPTLDLTPPGTISTQTVCTNLATCMVSQVIPIHVEDGVIIHMHKFVHDGMLHVLLIEEVPLAKHDCACVGRETARTSEVAGQTREVSWRGVYTSMLEMIEHELYRRAMVQEVLLPSLAVTTVDGEDAFARIDAITREQRKLFAPFLEYFVFGMRQ